MLQSGHLLVQVWTESLGAEILQLSGAQGNFGVMEMFLILIVAMAPWVYTYVKSHQIVPLNVCSSLYGSYTATKPILKKKSYKRQFCFKQLAKSQ